MPEDDDLITRCSTWPCWKITAPGCRRLNVAERWLAELPAGRVFTPERVAYRNLLLGFTPPESAMVRNPFRDWIGKRSPTPLTRAMPIITGCMCWAIPL